MSVYDPKRTFVSPLAEWSLANECPVTEYLLHAVCGKFLLVRLQVLRHPKHIWGSYDCGLGRCAIFVEICPPLQLVHTRTGSEHPSVEDRLLLAQDISHLLCGSETTLGCMTAHRAVVESPDFSAATRRMT